MVDSANFYLIGTLYPLWPARPTRSSASPVPGRGGASDADEEHEGEGAAGRRGRARRAARRLPEVLPRRPRFIGGEHPSIADIRLCATLEFLKAIDYDFPGWATEFMERVESALGEAYTEPAGDVRGFVAW